MVPLGNLNGKTYTMGKKQIGEYSLHFTEFGRGSYYNCELKDAKLQQGKGGFVGRKYFKNISWDA